MVNDFLAYQKTISFFQTNCLLSDMNLMMRDINFHPTKRKHFILLKHFISQKNNLLSLINDVFLFKMKFLPLELNIIEPYKTLRQSFTKGFIVKKHFRESLNNLRESLNNVFIVNKHIIISLNNCRESQNNVFIGNKHVRESLTNVFYGNKPFSKSHIKLCLLLQNCNNPDKKVNFFHLMIRVSKQTTAKIMVNFNILEMTLMLNDKTIYIGQKEFKQILYNIN